MSQHLLILYASETGTSEFLAQYLSKQLSLRNIQNTFQSIDTYPIH